MNIAVRGILTGLAAAVVATALPLAAFAQVVPGTGRQLTNVGDDFEEEDWSYQFNFPKASKELDEQTRSPMGRSTNGRWFESPKRGGPDILKRVSTPSGGLSGSEGAMLIQTLQSGIPGRLTYKMQQDDWLLNISGRVGGPISVSRTPNFTVRVFLPPFEQWEDRSGPSFAVRAGVRTMTTKASRSGLFGSRQTSELEPYWPGMFIQFRSKTDPRHEEDSAFFTIRATRTGSDFRGPEIKQLGWWTLGMSFTPDGQVHYYASPGVDELTPQDYLASQYPYGFRCQRFNTFFFNVCNQDDGRTWSTRWIIDDPKMYVVR